MITIAENVLADLRAHAKECYPKESCGFILIWKGRQRYFKVRNIAENQSQFLMHPEDQVLAEDFGEIVAIVHSHPNESPQPSWADKVGCEQSGLPWLIVNWPTGAIFVFEPSNYEAPLYGRPFAHGILDCYTFVQDYFKRELNITLPNVDRQEQWWLKGSNLYLEGFRDAGFSVLKEGSKLQIHDCFLCQVSSPVPNHAGVFLGNGLVGHHQGGRLSSRDVYGGLLEKATTHLLRHEEFTK